MVLGAGPMAGASAMLRRGGVLAYHPASGRLEAVAAWFRAVPSAREARGRNVMVSARLYVELQNRQGELSDDARPQRVP